MTSVLDSGNSAHATLLKVHLEDLDNLATQDFLEMMDSLVIRADQENPEVLDDPATKDHPDNLAVLDHPENLVYNDHRRDRHLVRLDNLADQASLDHEDNLVDPATLATQAVLDNLVPLVKPEALEVLASLAPAESLEIQDPMAPAIIAHIRDWHQDINRTCSQALQC